MECRQSLQERGAAEEGAVDGRRGRKPRVSRPWLGVVLLLALGSAALLLWSTPIGIGVGYDSYFYLTASENLLAGAGYRWPDGSGALVPLTHFPPVYPAAIAAAAGLFRLSPVQSARYLSALLLATNVVLLGLLLDPRPQKRWIAPLAAAFLLLSPVFIERHLWAMSEPLFFALVLITFGLISRYLAHGGIWSLTAAAIVAGLAYLTRYAGLSVVAAGVLGLLVYSSRSFWRRVGRAAAFSAGSLLVVLPWLVRNLQVAGSLTNRNPIFHPIPMERIRQAGRTIAGWVLPTAVPLELRAIISGLLVLGLLVIALVNVRSALLRAGRPQGRAILLGIFGIFIVCYGLLVVTSLSFLDASTRLNDRILSPLYLSLVVIGFLGLDRLRWQGGTDWARVLVILIGLVLIGYSYPQRMVTVLETSRARGFGFNSRYWTNSQLVEAVQGIAPGVPVYSNEAFPLSFHTGRPVQGVPERIDPVKGQEREDYRQQLGTMRSRLQAEDGYLALFHPENLRVEMGSLQELTQGLQLVLEFEEGVLYGTVR